MTSPLYIGIDVSKAQLDVGTTDRVVKQYTNTTAGHRALVAYLQKQGDVFVGIESTGVYSRAIADAIAHAGIPIAVIQATRVRLFARSRGQLAKTDAIDSRMIALYCSKTELKPYVVPSDQERALRALIDRRDQLVADLIREEGRLEACMDAYTKGDIRRNIKRLQTAIGRFDTRIDSEISEQEALQQKHAALQQEAGVGKQTAACLVAHLPELGQVNRQQIAALAGLAPFNRESGAVDGKRCIYGGRARVRRALYMAALVAVRWNEPLRDYYQKLVIRGKAKKLALIACARKLLIRLNTHVAALGHAS